jgi:hypothetical protein
LSSLFFRLQKAVNLKTDTPAEGGVAFLLEQETVMKSE